MDFADHILATRQEVKDFYSNDGPGPSLEDLHLDCSKGKSSQWNKAAMELMAAEFVDELENDKDITWPRYLSKFINKIVWDRFTRLMSIWKKAQPQINSDGELENLKQQENQIVAEREAALKENRHWTRQNMVSNLYVDSDTILTSLPTRNTITVRELLNGKLSIGRRKMTLIVTWRSGKTYMKLLNGMVKMG